MDVFTFYIRTNMDGYQISERSNVFAGILKKESDFKKGVADIVE